MASEEFDFAGGRHPALSQLSVHRLVAGGGVEQLMSLAGMASISSRSQELHCLSSGDPNSLTRAGVSSADAGRWELELNPFSLCSQWPLRV